MTGPENKRVNIILWDSKNLPSSRRGEISTSVEDPLLIIIPKGSKLSTDLPARWRSLTLPKRIWNQIGSGRCVRVRYVSDEACEISIADWSCMDRRSFDAFKDVDDNSDRLLLKSSVTGTGCAYIENRLQFSEQWASSSTSAGDVPLFSVQEGCIPLHADQVGVVHGGVVVGPAAWRQLGELVGKATDDPDRFSVFVSVEGYGVFENNQYVCCTYTSVKFYYFLSTCVFNIRRRRRCICSYKPQ